MNQEYLSKLHSEILDIMDIVDTICNKNHLSYFLTGGTLLGAIRHKGFIPWDDDFDIVMARSDYNTFLSICKTELPQGYSLLSQETSENWNRLFSKVYKTDTLFSEEIYPGHYSSYGIFIDIFPLDSTRGYSRILSLRKYLIKKIEVMINLKIQPKHVTIASKISNVFSVRFLHGVIRTLMTINDSSKSTNYYSGFGSQYSIKKQTFPKEYFNGVCYLPFENKKYRVPNEYLKVVSSIFGKDYMNLPPPEKRRSHYPHRVIFSDGKEIIFRDPIKRISIEDSL